MIQFAIAILFFLGTQQDQLTIAADEGPNREGNIVRYAGNVVATYQDMRLEADRVAYDETTKIINADGHIRFNRGEEHLEADHISVDVETKSGDLTNVRGEAGPGFFITAAEARRFADGRYELKNATVSTCCDMPRPGWTLALSRAVIDPNKRVSAKGSVFRLENIPFFYLPYVTMPTADRSRSSGFLIPSTSTSTSKGRSVRDSFYWAINRSADATFTGEYFTKRGPAAAVGFRAVPAPGAKIEIESLFAKDRKGQGGRSARFLGYGDFGRNFRAVADMNLVSSFVFRQVYEEGFNIISSPLEHSLGFLTRNDQNLSINALYGRNGVFFTDQPSSVLRKFPTLETSILDRSLGSAPVYFSADTSFTGIARRDADFKTSAFVERFDFHPAVEIPVVRSSGLDWSQRAGFRETFYTDSRRLGVSRDPVNRFSFDYASQIHGPQIERDFGRWRHVIEPTLDYRYIKGARRFRRTIVVDDVDLVTDTNEVEYGITSRFFTTREIFSWRLAQKYFLDPTFGGAVVAGKRNVFAPVLDISGFAFVDGRRRLSPIVSTMRLSTSASTSTDLQIDYDTRDHLFRSAGIIGNLNRGQFLGGVSYFFTRRSAIQIPNNQLQGTIGYGNGLKPGLSAALQFSYDIQRSLFQSSIAQIGYNTECYGLSFEMSQFNVGARVESRFRFAFTLKNIGSVGTLRRQERLF